MGVASSDRPGVYYRAQYVVTTEVFEFERFVSRFIKSSSNI